MRDPIDHCNVADFSTPVDADKVALRIAEAWQADPVDGPLRPVIWTASPLAPTGRLFLSVGALQIAHSTGIQITPVGRVPAGELPPHRALLLGEPRDRG